MEVQRTIFFLACYFLIKGFGGVGVACWPLVPKFAGSNQSEVVGFLGRKVFSTPSFGGEVKPSVPFRRFAAYKRLLNLSGSRNLIKVTGQFLAHNSPLRCQDFSRPCGRTGTWRRKWELLKAGERNGKLPPRFHKDAACQSHTGHMTGLWFLPTRLLRLNVNDELIS